MKTFKDLIFKEHVLVKYSSLFKGHKQTILNFDNGVKYANRWINTDEALPKNTKPVLVKCNTPSGRETMQVGRLYKSGWVTDTYFKVDVKEWKPIE